MQTPRSVAEVAQTEGYLRAWEAIGSLLSSGRSWSGHERNCAFLNTRDGRFASVAAVTQLDDPADSRAIGLTDWDGDGDLDAWIANRTAPRLRLFRNPHGATTHSLTLQLVGVRCNRDAIGARVEVRDQMVERSAPAHIRFVRAGEGYLAQSSKWLHFGLGDAATLLHVTVRWPDGSVQQFNDLQPDRAYRIVQGDELAEPLARDARPTPAAAGTPTSPPSAPLTRIVPHAPLPLPQLPALDNDGRPIDLSAIGDGQATLLVLWTSWCQPCLAELDRLARQQDELASWGLRVWVGNVENVDQPPAERQAAGERLWREAGLSLPGGLLTRPAVERLDLVQRVLLSLQEPLGVPTSFLLDSRRRLRAIYKGPPDNQQLRHDLQLLGSDDPRDYRDLAVPFAGHWYINPAPADLLALPRELLQTGDAAEAYAYLQRHIGTSQRPGGEADADWFAIFDAALADTYTQAGIELARQQHAADGREALRTALQVEPDRWQTLAALASLSSQQGRNREALATFQRMHELRPNDMLVANNLAWILATSRDDALRDPAQAVKLAEAVCDATQYRVLTALDTLAAAYAAAGRFDDAVRVAEQALSLAGPDNKSQAPRQRLEAYRQGKAYRE